MIDIYQFIIILIIFLIFHYFICVLINNLGIHNLCHPINVILGLFNILIELNRITMLYVTLNNQTKPF